MENETSQDTSLETLLEQCLVGSKPGKYLHTLRESSGISLEQIADQTLIPIKKLQYLELDQYEYLGGEAYIVAYIRKFGRILGVECNEVVDAYRAAALPQGSIVDLGRVERNSLGTDRPAVGQLKVLLDIPAKWMFTALILVWLMIMLLMGGKEGDNLSVTDELGSLSENPVEPPPEPVVEPITVDEIKPVTYSSSEPSIIAPLLDDQSSTEEVAEEVAEESESGAPAQNNLVMSFYEDSWVDVKDANGQQLIAELKRKGDNLQLFGEAPFSVMLGDARSVELVVDGTVIDTTPEINRRTLRLQVGE